MAVPILGQLPPVGRVVVLVALALSVLGIAMEYLLGIHGTPLFIVSAAAILDLAYVIGLSPSDWARSPVRTSAGSSTRRSATSPS